MRYVLAIILLLLVAGSATAFGYYETHRGLSVVLPPPTHVVADSANHPLLEGKWATSSAISIATKGVSHGEDIEVRRQGVPFTGTPTASTASPTGPRTLTVHLADGHYHVQVRTHRGNDISPWVPFHGGLSVDTHPPTAPNVQSSTDPNSTVTYHHSTATFNWNANDATSGVAGYSYRLDSSAQGSAPDTVRATQPTVTLTGLTTGTWYLHVRAVDHAGNWGPETSFPIHIDVTPPAVQHVTFSRYQFNPDFNSLQLTFSLSRPATQVRVGVYHQGDNKLIRMTTLSNVAANKPTVAWWNGKDSHGNLVPAGQYSVYVRPTDQYGHSSLTGWRDFTINYQRIVVSLSKESLTAYDGNKVVYTTLVTTGNRALPTPTGTYTVMAKYSPYKFISPWPKSSPYYYAPSPVNWALYFRQGGYFIHDSPWRSAYGPGTNSVLGTPGTNYTGSHGCVNVPEGIMGQLYA